MPLSVEITPDRAQLAALRRTLQRAADQSPRIMGAALRDGGRKLQRDSTRGVSKQLRVPQRRIKRRRTIRLNFRRDGGNVTGFTVTVGSHRFPIGKQGSRQTRQGVRTRTHRGSVMLEGAFLARLPWTSSDGASGQTELVMVRGGSSPGYARGRAPYRTSEGHAMPIHHAHTVSPGHIFQRTRELDALPGEVVQDIDRFVLKRLERLLRPRRTS